MKSPYLHLLKQSTAAVRATLRNVRHQVPTLALAGVASLTLFTSCLEDAVPTTGYTQKAPSLALGLVLSCSWV